MGILVYRDRLGMKDLTGRIDFTRGEPASFQYDGSYLARARAANELGISQRLPLDSAPFGDAEIGPFFQGVLPEGPVFGNLLQMYQIARNDYLSVLEQLGCESIGALTFVSERIDDAEYEPRYEPLTLADVGALRDDPIRAATITTSTTRLSLAGAQSKVAWHLPFDVSPRDADLVDWLVPYGTAPSSYIVKLARTGEERLAENERACSLLAKACGIDTPDAFTIPDLPGAIAVRRYDRTISDNGLVRLHQEDFCQAIGFPPHLKYQPDSGEGDYLVYCADLIEAACADPRSDLIEFGKRLVFSFAVGNSDAHLKNSALLYNPEWTAVSLAPLYDVTCIPLAGYSTRMPFRIGEHRELAEIDERDIMSIALDMGIGLDDFDEATREVVNGLDSPAIPASEASAESAVAAIIDNAAQRIKVLKRYLGT